jgi:hypothetical protein
MRTINKETLCAAIGASLREFGYPTVTTQDIVDCWEAYERGDKDMPHDVVGMFAERQLAEIAEKRPDLLTRGAAERTAKKTS